MVCKDHTAQLSPELAREYQEKFVKKEINVLSCSTTFEMGVDVGELETIFMKNMPPTPANYIQRAGGYSEVEKQNNRRNFILKEHNNPYGVVCKSDRLNRKTFGHIFKTDVVILSCDEYLNKEKALSTLYALLEGISNYLGIERDDISGTIHSKKTQAGNWQTAFIIFDTVPGGAGHVRRIGTSTKKEFYQMLQTSYSVVSNCTCGIESEGDSACYNCLCNYYNQAYHDILKRKYAIEFLGPIIK